MADIKISALTAATTIVPGTDVLPIVSNSGADTVKATPNQIVQAVLPAPGAIGGTTPNTGAFTNLSSNGTVSGTGFSNYLTTQLASPPAIGGTAPNTGAFTTLSASSTVSGSGFDTYVANKLSSPPAIGNTAANTGAFTTLSASSTVSGTGFFNYITGWFAAPPPIGDTNPNIGYFTKIITSAGSTTIAPIYMTSGTNLTTATAGAWEYDGTNFYATPAAIRAAVCTPFVVRRQGAITIANTAATGLSILTSSTSASASTGIALAASTTYEFEIRFVFSSTGVTSHTESVGFYYSGTTSYYNYEAERKVANVATSAVTYAQVASGTTLTSNIITTVMTPAITTAQTNAIYTIRGWVTTNTAGNWTPVIYFSAAPGATSTVGTGCTVKLTPYQSTSGGVNISTWA